VAPHVRGRAETNATETSKVFDDERVDRSNAACGGEGSGVPILRARSHSSNGSPTLRRSCAIGAVTRGGRQYVGWVTRIAQ
jgi:hypothetical protein